MSRWIDIQYIPQGESFTDYLVYIPSNGIGICCKGLFSTSGVTHWMELPEPPAQIDNDHISPMAERYLAEDAAELMQKSFHRVMTRAAKKLEQSYAPGLLSTQECKDEQAAKNNAINGRLEAMSQYEAQWKGRKYTLEVGPTNALITGVNLIHGDEIIPAKEIKPADPKVDIMAAVRKMCR